ncbi:phospholipid hydroperoxide glutathione peroxidase [Citrus sinensis]|uniref:Phospholipid hydroperoxide glutathione peroxidase n=1 Tax=Citrus sinensis TaxID=2711 RepID=A0ACB8L8L7_CITSI|nr:phospholipid hydroperoxide glutathione peroxidase [Citrus sinensis]
MRFLRRIAGFLGIVRDNGPEVKDDEEDQDKIDDNNNQRSYNFQETGLPRKGFGVQVQVAVERPLPGPIIVPCNSGNGGIQGLRWYAKRLRIDDDGDVADEFLDEVLPQTSASEEEQHRPLPKFEVRYSTRPVKVKNQVLTTDGKIQQCVEYRGSLLWV